MQICITPPRNRVKELVSDNIDVLVIEETKLDKTFPENAFMIPGYKYLLEKTETLMGEGY